MKFDANHIYHVYNRGNNKQLIALDDTDYQVFRQDLHRFIKPCCEVLAWCIMPNHFHLLIYTNPASIAVKKVGGLQLQQLTNGIKLLLSSYTKAVNKKYGRSGSLFQQKTKAKCVNATPIENYSEMAMHYVHQNPYKAKLVSANGFWPYSSLIEYIGTAKDDESLLINKLLAETLFDTRLIRFGLQCVVDEAKLE